jgi:hypothetical protein
MIHPTTPTGLLRYLLIGHVLIPAVINAAINSGVGWLSVSGLSEVQVWSSDRGAVADLLGTSFFLPLITCLIATPLVRRDKDRARIGGLPHQYLPYWMRWLQRPLPVRALQFGITGIVLLSVPICLLWEVFAGSTITVSQFLVIKTTFAVALGTVVTPVTAVLALADMPEKKSDPAADPAHPATEEDLPT